MIPIVIEYKEIVWRVRVMEGTSETQIAEMARIQWNLSRDMCWRIRERAGSKNWYIVEVKATEQVAWSKVPESVNVKPRDGMAREVQDQLQVWFRDWTYCLDRNGLWKARKMDWTGGQIENGTVTMEGNVVRIDIRGLTFWLWEDGYWTQKKEHPLSGADRQAPPVRSPVLQKTTLPRLE
jgi:hypothetical protein